MSLAREAELSTKNLTIMKYSTGWKKLKFELVKTSVKKYKRNISYEENRQVEDAG